MYTVRHEGQLLIIPDSNAEIDNYVTNMTSSVLLLSDECHEETAIMSSHSSRSMVIGELKALQLILAYSLESTLKGRLVITAAPRKTHSCTCLGDKKSGALLSTGRSHQRRSSDSNDSGLGCK